MEQQIRLPELGKSQTGWGKFVSPYIKDFTAGTSGAVNAIQLLK
jgi:hypothetical protein